MTSRLQSLTKDPLMIAASVLLAVSITAIVLGVDFRVDADGTNVSALSSVVLIALGLSLGSLAAQVTRVIAGSDASAPAALATSAVVFVIAIAVAFSVLMPGSNPMRLITFPQ